MKKLLLLSALLIFACSSDDSSDNNDDTTQLFLEKYDGVMWGSAEIHQDWNNLDGGEFSAFWITYNSTGYNVWDNIGGAGPLQGTIICNEYNAVWGEADSEGNISTIQEETEDSLTITFNDVTSTWIVSPDGNFIAIIQAGESEPNWDTINDIDDIDLLGDDFIMVRFDNFYDDVTIPPYGC